MSSIRSKCDVFRAALIAVLMLAVGNGVAATDSDVELWRLDCGEFPNWKIDYLSDVFAYSGKTKTLTNSCYLIRHGQQYMLWDTGFSTVDGVTTTAGPAILDQLAQIGVDPAKISLIGISHWHFDHTGQAAKFPQARLLLGKGDFELLAEKKSADIAPWLGEKANVEEVSGDKDVFGDGSVVMLATLGHTPGHHSLLIRLKEFGPVILSGDLWHVSDQVSHSEVPIYDVDRAATLASRERILKAAANLKAKIVIQHEKADVPVLPAFPASAH